MMCVVCLLLFYSILFLFLPEIRGQRQGKEENTIEEKQANHTHTIIISAGPSCLYVIGNQAFTVQAKKRREYREEKQANHAHTIIISAGSSFLNVVGKQAFIIQAKKKERIY